MAQHKLKLAAHGLSLVRMKMRFGIRVEVEHEAQTHKELRPGEDFHKVDVSFIYRIHPIPHGLQRSQVAQLLREWKWAAKLLQPSRGSTEGGSWDVGASTAPPSNTMTEFSCDVLIKLIIDSLLLRNHRQW